VLRGKKKERRKKENSPPYFATFTLWMCQPVFVFVEPGKKGGEKQEKKKKKKGRKRGEGDESSF